MNDCVDKISDPNCACGLLTQNFVDCLTLLSWTCCRLHTEYLDIVVLQISIWYCRLILHIYYLSYFFVFLWKYIVKPLYLDHMQKMPCWSEKGISRILISAQNMSVYFLPDSLGLRHVTNPLYLCLSLSCSNQGGGVSSPKSTNVFSWIKPAKLPNRLTRTETMLS